MFAKRGVVPLREILSVYFCANAFAATRRAVNTPKQKDPMKKPFLILLALAGLVSTSVLAASGGKEITLKGTAQCAKCVLKEGTECQTTLQVEKDGKKTTYYLGKNDVADKFHEAVCKGPKEATVTAVCKKEGDKLVLTASKAETTK